MINFKIVQSSILQYWPIRNSSFSVNSSTWLINTLKRSTFFPRSFATMVLGMYLNIWLKDTSCPLSTIGLITSYRSSRLIIFKEKNLYQLKSQLVPVCYLLNPSSSLACYHQVVFHPISSLYYGFFLLSSIPEFSFSLNPLFPATVLIFVLQLPIQKY